MQTIELILSPKAGEPQQVTYAKSLYSTSKDAAAALKSMPQYMHVEHSVLRGIVRHGPDAPRPALL